MDRMAGFGSSCSASDGGVPEFLAPMTEGDGYRLRPPQLPNFP